MAQCKLNEVKKFSSIREMLDLAKAEVPEQIAFRHKENKEVKDVTFNQFYEDVYSLGTALAELGIEKTHIACIGENSYRWVNAFLSVLCSDSVFVGIDKELPAKDFIHIINNSDSEVLFYWRKTEDVIRENLESFSKIKYFIGIDREADDGNFLSFDLLREKGRILYKEGSKKYIDQSPEYEDLKMLIYTSGTTGIAKGVMLSQKNIVSCVYYGLQVSTIYESGLSILPYHHAYEAVCGILVGIHKHTTICINESLKNIAKNLVFYKPSYMYVVPAVANALYNNIIRNAQKGGKLGALKVLIKISNALRKVGIDIRKKAFGSIHEALGGNLRKVVCGGAPVPDETAHFFDSIGIQLFNGYGITECSPLVSVNTDYNNDYRTVGYPLPCLDVKIIDQDSDGIGEICVKGDTVMMGYYKMPELNAETLIDGWFATGDYGYMNKKGQLIITGRKKNIIVLDNGKNIYPEEIENYIYTLPYVKEAVVYDSDDNGQKVLCAEIYPDTELLGDSDVNADICSVLKELPSYKQISKIVLRETEFVKNSSQKIKRNEIVKK